MDSVTNGSDGWTAAVALAVHNTALILAARYSLAHLHETYSLAVLVVLIHLAQVLLCGAWLWIGGTSGSALCRLVSTCSSIRRGLGGAFFAAIALFQLLALKHLPAAQFALGQTSKLVLALVLRAVLNGDVKGTGIGGNRGRFSFMILVGCGLVFLNPLVEGSLDGTHVNDTFEIRSSHIGLLALLGTVMLDAFAQVYLERSQQCASPTDVHSTKSFSFAFSPFNSSGKPDSGVWERHLVTSLWGLAASLVLVCASDWPLVRGSLFGVLTSEETTVAAFMSNPGTNLLQGVSAWACGLVVLQSVGNLALAKLAPNADRSQATVSIISVCSTVLFSLVFFSLRCTAENLSGAILICIAVWSWSLSDPDSEMASPRLSPSTDDEELSLGALGREYNIARQCSDSPNESGTPEGRFTAHPSPRTFLDSHTQQGDRATLLDKPFRA